MLSTIKEKTVLSDPADALQRIEEVLRLSRSAIWEVDRRGVYTYASASHEDLLGYRPEELVGIRTIHDFYPPDLPPGLAKELTEDWIGAGQEFTQGEVPLVTKSGETVWVMSHGTPIFDDKGRVAGFRGTDVDITQRKRAEEEVRASERLLLRQITEAPVPMAYTGRALDGTMHVNTAFVRTFGYEPEEVATTEAWFARAYPDEAYRREVMERSARLFEAAGRGEPPGAEEYRVTCKDGRVLDVEIAATLVAGAFVGTFVDVTERKREARRRQQRANELFAILDNLPFPVATSVAGPDFDWRDPRAEVTFLNRRFIALFGYTREDVSDLPAAMQDLVVERASAVLREWAAKLQAAFGGAPADL